MSSKCIAFSFSRAVTGTRWRVVSTRYRLSSVSRASLLALARSEAKQEHPGGLYRAGTVTTGAAAD